MPIRTAPKRPLILTPWLLDRKIVDACEPQPHQAMFIKFPILIAIRPEPIPGVIVPFVREAHRDTVSGERPHFLDEPVVQLPNPLAREEGYDFVSSINELRAVPPS